MIFHFNNIRCIRYHSFYSFIILNKEEIENGKEREALGEDDCKRVEGDGSWDCPESMVFMP